MENLTKYLSILMRGLNARKISFITTVTVFKSIVRSSTRTTRISARSTQLFERKCRTTTYQKSFFVRTTRIWNLLTLTDNLMDLTLDNFTSALRTYYTKALKINYNPDSPRSFNFSFSLFCLVITYKYFYIEITKHFR